MSNSSTKGGNSVNLQIDLRDYQQECIAEINKNEKAGIKKQLAVLPTGSGKTIVFGTLAKQRNDKTLILAHRDELIQQAVDKVEMVWDGADIGVVKAERNEIGHQVTVASVQTLDSEKRIEKLEKDFDLIITDEAHHSPAESYQFIYDHLHAGTNGNLHLGVTATPNRTDKVGLIASYDKVVYEKNLIEMIVNGYLCDLRSEIIQVYDAAATEIQEILSGRTTKTVGTRVMRKVLNIPEVQEHIVSEWKRLARDRQTIAFCASVDHAYQMASLFRKNGVKAECVSDRTTSEARADILKDYQDGKLQIVTNFNILTEGFDSPPTSCILVARPTHSDLVYAQMIGRGTRTFPGKKDCLILDVASISETRELLAFADLMGSGSLPDKNKSVLENVEGDVKVRQALQQDLGLHFDIQIDPTRKGDVFASSRFAWVEHKGDYKIYTGRKLGKIHLALDKPTGKFRIILEGKTLRDAPIPLDYAMTLAETYVNRHDNNNFAKRNHPWRAMPATDRQINMIERYGRNGNQRVLPGLTRGQAAEILETIMWNWKPKSNPQERPAQA